MLNNPELMTGTMWALVAMGMLLGFLTLIIVTVVIIKRVEKYKKKKRREQQRFENNIF